MSRERVWRGAPVLKRKLWVWVCSTLGAGLKGAFLLQSGASLRLNCLSSEARASGVSQRVVQASDCSPPPTLGSLHLSETVQQ